MTSTKTFLGSAAAAILAALSIVAGTASATSPPPLTAGPGCSVRCISKALVTVTATTAKVELETTVVAHLKLTVSKASAGGNVGGFTTNQAKTVSISAFSLSRTASFSGLEPDTTYTIVVKATDLKGRSSSRQGTFETLPIKTTGLGGPDGIASNVGCSVQCITKALVSQKQPDASSSRIDIATSTPARIQIDVSRDKPVQTAAGLAQYDVVSRQTTPGFTKSWSPQVGGLDFGTRYYVVVRAKDANGHVSIRQGSFRTVSATATVTLHKIKVLNDGDKVGKGELFFRLWLGDDVLSSWGTGLRKLNSGDVTPVNALGSSRPGFSFQVSANGDAKFDMYMLGEECDAVFKKNCILEAWGESVHQWARAGGRFDISDLLEKGALPGWYGTGVSAPPGHDGYFVLGTTDRYVKFLVMATIDIDVDWP